MAKRTVKRSKPPASQSVRDGEQPSPQLVLASPVAGVANLQAILVDHFSASRNVEPFDDLKEARQPSNAAINIEVNHEERIFKVKIALTLKLFLDPKNDEAASAAVEIECAFVLIYGVPSVEGLSDESLFAFARTSGLFSIWPYWREFVHSSTLRLSVPSILIPTYRL